MVDEAAVIVPIQFEKVLQSRAYTCVVLGTPEKKFAIYTDPSSGKAMHTFLAATEKTRPSTHDLIHSIFLGFDIKVKHIIIYDLQDTIYFGRLFLEQSINEIVHIVEIDARPSDCISLALLFRAPIFCTEAVLEKTIAYAE